MQFSKIESLQDSASSLVDAAGHLGQAAGDLSKVVLPAAKNSASKLPVLASQAIKHASTGMLKQDRKKLVAAGVGTTVMAAAVVGHLVYHHRAFSAYRELRAEEKEAAQINDALTAVFDCAAEVMSACEFEQRYAAGQDGLPASAEVPGCFAILTYDFDAAPGSFDLYHDVYVGASATIAQGVHKHLSGEGNLYIHADMVYERPVFVAFFPCEEYELYALKEKLVDVFGADGSYNRISELAQLD